MANTIEPSDEWLPIPEAAAKLGIAENALRSRIKRRTVRARKDNQGRLVVCLPSTEMRPRTIVRSKSGPGSNHASEPAPEALQSTQGAVEAVPLPCHREIVDGLQAAMAALRSDLSTERQRHEAEIERLIGQVHAERQFWIERADAAECRAEAAEQRVVEMVTRPWWRR
jgi:hypothetical protein